MKPTTLSVSVPLLCALSTVVYGAPAHRPSSGAGVQTHVGFSEDVQDQQISLQSSDFESTDEFDTDALLPSVTAEDGYEDYPLAETPVPSTRLMEMSYEKGQRKSENKDQEYLFQTYPTQSKSHSHGTFYPSPETWTTSKRNPKTASTPEQPLFSSPDPETTPYGLVDSLLPSILNFNLELDTEALLIWAHGHPVWAWSIVGCCLVGLGVLAVAIVEVAVRVLEVVRSGMRVDWSVARRRREETKLTDELDECVRDETEKVMERFGIEKGQRRGEGC